MTLSCNYFEETSDKVSFYSTISESDKIRIKPKRFNQNESVREDSCFENTNKYQVDDLKEIENFEKLFENSEYTGYCCCPDTDFAIDFYRESQKIETYFADTIKYVDKVQVFEESFQFSFLIDKKKWKSYLMEIENK
ncbi:hypothetical protein GCM10022386_05860 [Flavobacterium cheonhonense]|uniref:Lipoprotein n=1 Tax=Flavobacterium cheonhonense TaxID=706185 RepID=A0ABP7TFD8_9FLAO